MNLFMRDAAIRTFPICAVALQLLLHASSSEAAAARPVAGGWQRVTDGLGSSVDIPPDTTISHDGEVVVLEIKNLKARFWTVTESRAGFPGHDPKGDMDLKRSDCNQWPPSYYVVRERMAVYSCISGGNVSYYVARYGGSGGVFLFASYPEKDKESFKEIISHMSSSMTQTVRFEAIPK